MGLLTEDLMESSEITCGTLYTCTDVYTSHQSFDTLGGYGGGLFQMKIGNPRKQDICRMVETLPVISDSKGRIRLDPDALIRFVCGCFSNEIGNALRASKCEVSISSTKDEVYYVIYSDYQFEDTTYDRHQVMRITTKKL